MRWILFGLFGSLTSALPSALPAVEVEHLRRNANTTSDGIAPTCGPGETLLVGNGNPVPKSYHEQVSDMMPCGSQDSCSISHSVSHTVGYSVSASIAQWITGGFTVSESWTSGNAYTCDGNPGQKVCIWLNVDYTQYTVQNAESIECGGYSSPRTITSPDANNEGSGFYCVYGDDCRSQGSNYWAS